MTRKKAIEILEEIIDEGWLISDFEKCTAIDACEMAIKALEQEPKWIPVSERLPEEAFGCLVTVEEDDRNGEPQRVLYPEFVGYDGETWNNADGYEIPFEVVAWMPLPIPYQAESEDKE